MNLRRLAPILLVLTTACASAPRVPDLYRAQLEVVSYIDSGGYLADLGVVVTQARTYLENRAKLATKPAIVLDIDETSLSNWPAYRANGWGRITAGECDLDKGPCGLRAWQGMAKSKAIEPVLGLAKRAKELGVAVFFISGRPPALREATERNLKEQGYTWDGVVVLPEGKTFKSAVDFKAPERKKLADAGYTILFTLGDQQSDLDGGFAEKTFKLPNPVYFLP
jgi:acid phosphatase